MKTWMKSGGLAAALALTLAACGADADVTETPETQDRSGDAMAEVIGDAGSLSTVNAALESTGLDGVLEGDAAYTLFAPTDTAFDALGDDGKALIADKERGAIVAAILREHMVPGALTPDAIKEAIKANGGEVVMSSFGAGDLTFAMDGDAVKVTNADGQSARLTGGASVAKNGVAIPIDAVLADPAALQGSDAPAQ